MTDTVAILLAGGAGERLFPLTRQTAKPAVPFGGIYRLIDFTLSNCLNSGLRRIYILTQYKSLELARHLREGWGFLAGEVGEFIEIIPPMKRVHEDWYLGTADAVYQNLESIEAIAPRQILVLGADHIYKMNYTEMLQWHHERPQKSRSAPCNCHRPRRPGSALPKSIQIAFESSDSSRSPATAPCLDPLFIPK